MWPASVNLLFVLSPFYRPPHELILSRKPRRLTKDLFFNLPVHSRQLVFPTGYLTVS